MKAILYLATSALVLFLFFDAVQANADGFVSMQAFTSDLKPLPETVELYYMIAPDFNRSVPVLQKHQGEHPVFFSEKSGLDPHSYIGIYLPTGDDAYYRYALGEVIGGQCDRADYRFGNWLLYDKAYPVVAKQTPLQLGVDPMPSLTQNGCVELQWKVVPDDLYHGNISDLIEKPITLPNGVESMNATDVLTGKGSGATGASVRFEVAGDEGDVGRSLKIGTGNHPLISIIHNIGAPTDDGMVWGIAVQNSFGLYGNEGDHLHPVNFGASQFVGHPDDGTIFGHTQWGFYMPTSLQGETLQTDDTRCKPSRCYVPMYTDFTTASNKTHRGTLPFSFPRSAHPFDGRIKVISLTDVPSLSGIPWAN